MISICTVLYSGCSVFIKALLESISLHCKVANEVIIVHIDAEDFYEKTWVENGIEFKQFGYPLLEVWPNRNWNVLGNGHALGIHACVDKAQGEYLLFTDPDLFFYTSVDAFYLDLMEKHKIDYIGISHHAAMTQAFTWFPCLTNCMVKKSALPDKDFLKGYLKVVSALHINNLDDVNIDDAELMNGYWALQGPIKGFWDKFPNKDLSPSFGLFDVGCNLYLWSLEKNWRWLAFQTTDCHSYNSVYNRSNFGLKEKFKKQNLLYHLISGSRGGEEAEVAAKEKFFEEFDKVKETND